MVFTYCTGTACYLRALQVLRGEAALTVNVAMARLAAASRSSGTEKLTLSSVTLGVFHCSVRFFKCFLHSSIHGEDKGKLTDPQPNTLEHKGREKRKHFSSCCHCASSWSMPLALLVTIDNLKAQPTYHTTASCSSHYQTWHSPFCQCDS